MSKFNFKFSSLLHMSKCHICIRNYMKIVVIGLHYDHLNLFSFAIIIIGLVSPERSTTLGQFSVSQFREEGSTSDSPVRHRVARLAIFVAKLKS